MEENKRVKELLQDIETEIIVDKNVKLFNELREKEMEKEKQFLRFQHIFENYTGLTNNFVMWTMFIMGIIGLIAAWLF